MEPSPVRLRGQDHRGSVSGLRRCYSGIIHRGMSQRNIGVFLSLLVVLSPELAMCYYTGIKQVMKIPPIIDPKVGAAVFDTTHK